jgi:predicted amidohydrolase YtcJ
MLKVGYLADMVIMGDDLLTIPPEQIIKTEVDYTIVGGRIVFNRQGD